MPILVKRYGGERLYDTAGCCYVTFAQLWRWRVAGVDFRVIDAATGEDITRVVLG
jgi:polyhydroxyalkanoate synthesis regulator protein